LKAEDNDKMAKNKKSEKRAAAREKQKQLKNKTDETDDDVALRSQLSKLDLEMREITGDGNCLFRAISDQMTGRENNHKKFRKEACTFINDHRGNFHTSSSELDIK